MLLDMVAQRYGQRPSDLAGIADPRVALDFDIAVAFRAIKEAEIAAKTPPEKNTPSLREAYSDHYDEWGNCIDFSPIIH